MAKQSDSRQHHPLSGAVSVQDKAIKQQKTHCVLLLQTAAKPPAPVVFLGKFSGEKGIENEHCGEIKMKFYWQQTCQKHGKRIHKRRQKRTHIKTEKDSRDESGIKSVGKSVKK